jgi:hypothetical protein
MENSVSGGVRLLPRLEGLVLLAGAAVLYGATGASWWLFALLFLAPDLSMLGYLGGPRIGAAAYNAAHATIGPVALGLIGWVTAPGLVPLALIWLAHIGFDRALGYGLKYASDFRDTHLGRIGRD